MRTPVVSPWRGPGPGRPGVPLPPARMPLLRGGRPLKRWTWVAAFGAEAIVCAARVSVGGVPTAWWCVLDRRSGSAAEGVRGVDVSASRLAIRGRAELALGDGGQPVEVVSPHGRQYAWTRKRGGVRAHGWVLAGGGRRALDAAAIVDESAGYHARATAWRWSAGVGTAESGAAVAWNLVDGLHDDGGASERTVWVDGEAHAVGPAAFGRDLATVGRPGAGGSSSRAESSPAADADDSSAAGSWRLACAAEHVLRRRVNLLAVRSDLEQRFGAVTGSLPVAGALSAAWGVVERHDVRW